MLVAKHLTWALVPNFQESSAPHAPEKAPPLPPPTAVAEEADDVFEVIDDACATTETDARRGDDVFDFRFCDRP